MMGMEMLIKQILKGLELDPDQIKGHIEGLVATVKEIDGRMTRIEANQTEILSLLRDNQNVAIRSEPSELSAAVGD